MAILILLGIGLFALAVLPGIWVKHVLRKHQAHRPDLPGTGAELARHLLDGMKLQQVTVEQTDIGDHYDPEAKAVRLSPEHFNGKSISAVAVAAHEVGHAMQDATDYKPLRARTEMARRAHSFQRIGAIVMFAAPVMVVLFKSPAAMLLNIVAGIFVMLGSVIVHAFTLPVEFDASYGRALPVLEEGGFLSPEDMKPARQVLKAAAMTYVAAAAMSLLNVAHWIRVLR